jgi:hypothetical protein
MVGVELEMAMAPTSDVVGAIIGDLIGCLVLSPE